MHARRAMLSVSFAVALGIGCGSSTSHGTNASVQGDGGIWLDAEIRINRADFGLTWNPMGMVGVNNTLAIHAVFTRR